MAVFNNLGGQAPAGAQLSYSDFISEVRSGSVRTATIAGREIRGQRSDDSVFSTYSPETDNRALIGDLLDAEVEIKAEPPEDTNFLLQLLLNTFPFLLFIGIWIYFCLLYTSDAADE